MELKTISYNPEEVVERETDFKKEIKKYSNVVYFFYNDEKCLYVGETSESLYERCFVNTPKEKDEEWFKNGNKVQIIKIDDDPSGDKLIDTRNRHAIESLFILINKPKYNIK